MSTGYAQDVWPWSMLVGFVDGKPTAIKFTARDEISHLIGYTRGRPVFVASTTTPTAEQAEQAMTFARALDAEQAAAL